MSVSLTNSSTFESLFDSPGLPPFRGPRRNNKPGVYNTKIIIPLSLGDMASSDSGVTGEIINPGLIIQE